VTSLAQVLKALGAEFEESLNRLNLAAYVVDASGRVRWLNLASIALIGPRFGVHFASVVAPEYSHEAQRAFTRKLLGSEGSVDRELVVLGPSGGRTRVVSSGVPLKGGGRIVGVFGIARVVQTEQPMPHTHLTPRQSETLHLLADGASTEEIASRLGVARETARGHIRRLLAALDVHSRLEAVARARDLGLVSLLESSAQQSPSRRGHGSRRRPHV
jgi:DNA-binding CsgD family transcriptional regulator